MSADLKPCPFCGGPASLEDERLIFIVRCSSCGSCILGERMPEPEGNQPEPRWEPYCQSAVDRWNCRTKVELTDQELLVKYKDTGLIAPSTSEAMTFLRLANHVVPTDEEIMELMPQQMHEDLAVAACAMAGTENNRVKGIMRIILNRHIVDHARAVLARWG